MIQMIRGYRTWRGQQKIFLQVLLSLLENFTVIFLFWSCLEWIWPEEAGMNWRKLAVESIIWAAGWTLWRFWDPFWRFFGLPPTRKA